MSFLTISNGRIQTDSSTQLGEVEMSGLFSKKKKKKGGIFGKLKKLHFKMKTFAPHRLPITLIKKLIDKKKKGKKKKRGGGGGGDQYTEESAVDTGAPEESVVPAALQPPNTNPFQTYPGPMSPGTYPMAPSYPSPMQPPMEYPSAQFPQAYPGGGEQPYYAPERQDSMPQFINTEEESEWQPPTPMYDGPSAYENDPGQRGVQYQQSQQSPFDTSENEYASGPDAGDNFAPGSEMSGYLVSGGGGSWEDQGWGGMAGEYDAAITDLLNQARVMRLQGQEGTAQAMENQARQLQAMQRGGSSSAESTGNLILWGGLALAAWFIYKGKW
jgi:hypothetical protein